MGLNKMEKEFSEKLNQREIKPSANSWDRLDAMLSVAEQKKPQRKFNWMYAAASFLGIALIATFFFNREPGIDVSNKVVVEEPEIMIDYLPEKPQVIDHNISSPEKTATSKRSVGSINQNQTQIAQYQPQEQTNAEIRSGETESINQKTDIPKADELLAIAESSINQTQTKTVKVNAKSLLSQVDGEVELTFREKVLQKVGTNYQSVKVALANRNIENENH